MHVLMRRRERSAGEHRHWWRWRGQRLRRKRCHIPYDIVVTTADKAFAGTSANVFIEIYASSGDHTDKLPLNKSTTPKKTMFERGKSDEFIVKAMDVGNVHHVVVSFDASGMGADWYVSTVSVNGKSFKCDKELTKKNPSVECK